MSGTSSPQVLNKEPFATRPALLALLVILAFAAALRVWTFDGWSGGDDAEYARFAAFLAQGRPFPSDYAGPPVFALRVGMVAPVGLFFWLFGVNEWAMVAYPLLLSLASIVVIYVSASQFFGWRAGLMAALLLATFHIDLANSTNLLPDLPAAFFSAAAVTLIVALDRRESWHWSSNIGGGLVAGLSLGLAWFCKESVAYLAPFMLVLLAITTWRSGKRMWFVWAGVAIGSASALAGEMIAYQIAKGDLLFRFHELERNYRMWENGLFTEGSILGWQKGTSRASALLQRLFVTGPQKILLDSSVYYVPLIGLIAAAYAWMKRDRAFLIPGLWLFALVLMFNFGSSSLSEYIPLPLYYRYMYPMYFPAIVLVAGLLERTLAPLLSLTLQFRDIRSAGVGLLVGGLIVWTAAPFLYFNLVKPHDWTEEVRQLHTTVRPEDRVYADGITLLAFEFFADYPERTAWTDFSKISSSEDIPAGSLVLVNKKYIEWLNRNAGMWVAFPPGQTDRSGYRMHAFYEHPPANWTEVWKNSNASLYRTADAVAAR